MIDLDYLMQFYDDHGKLKRLEFIMQDSKLKLDCLERSLPILLNLKSADQYQQMLKKLNNWRETLGLTLVTGNIQQLSEISHSNTLKLSRLEQELKTYNSNFIRESIRIGNLELAEFYYSQGDLQQSLKYYSIAKDNSSTQIHNCEQLLKIIELGIELQNYQVVFSSINKCCSILNQMPHNDALMNRLVLLNGVYHLEMGNFKQACLEMMKLKYQNETIWSLISGRDIAIYSVLLMLVTMDRLELKEMMENQDFKQYLELEPKIREILRLFYLSDFKQVFTLLNEFKVLFVIGGIGVGFIPFQAYNGYYKGDSSKGFEAILETIREFETLSIIYPIES